MTGPGRRRRGPAAPVLALLALWRAASVIALLALWRAASVIALLALWPAAPVLALLALWPAASAYAGEADVMEVHAVCSTIRTCDFQVKVRHADIGWSHYADRFEIVTPDGELLATRVLRHPHVHEQPFVRGLVGVEIPEGVDRVTVRAGDSKHGLGGETVTVALTFPASDGRPGGADAAAPPAVPD